MLPDKMPAARANSPHCNRLPMNSYLLAFAHPALAAHYQRAQLCAADLARLEAKPALEARLQWQTSRALLACVQTRHSALHSCLSHKEDYAALALGHNKPGVDLEKLRPRDFQALAAHSFSAQEYAWLAQSRVPAQAFYQLWTLKEALIKAEDLAFPTDLRHCGLHDGRLFSPRGQSYRWLSLLLDGQWLLSALWPDMGELPADLQLFTPHPVAVEKLDGNLDMPGVQWHECLYS